MTEGESTKAENILPEWAEEMFGILEELEDLAMPKLPQLPKVSTPEKHDAIPPKRPAPSLPAWFPRWVEWLKSSMEQEADEGPAEQASPPWLNRIEKECAQAFMPTMNLKALAQHRPTQSIAITLGEIVGHAHEQWSPNNPCLAVQLASLKPPLGDYFRAIYDAIRPAHLAIIQKALCVTTKLEHIEAKQFFRGYSLAMQKGTISDAGRPSGETYATNIYLMMFAFSEFIERLKSVREFHEWLQLMLGKNVVGDIKRVEKICERIGLSFRPPGRPASE